MNYSDNLNICVTKINTVAEREPNPLWHMEKKEKSDFFILAVALKGESVYEMNGREYQIHRGDALFFSKSFLRSAKSSGTDPWRFITIAFDMHFFDGGKKDLDLPPITVNVPDSIISLFTQVNTVWTAKESGFLLKSRSLIEDIIYRLMRLNIERQYNQVHYHVIDEVRQYIYQNYQKPIKIQDLANICNCSVSHFRKLFRSITGTGALNYLNTIRIQKACDLLSAGDIGISQVASRAGFSDIYYFSRYFKKVTGVCPSDYAKKRKESAENC